MKKFLDAKTRTAHPVYNRPSQTSGIGMEFFTTNTQNPYVQFFQLPNIGLHIGAFGLSLGHGSYSSLATVEDEPL
jgi:hypothetical protein